LAFDAFIWFAMAIYEIEKLGGIAGFGGAHLRSRGKVDSAALSADENKAIEALFSGATKRSLSSGSDAFMFRISRSSSSGNETVQVPEHLVPAALTRAVQDELI